MGLASFLVAVLLVGLVVGALARLAVPGPDPMPIWLTIAFGVAGSALGGLVSRLFFHAGVSLPLALIGAIVLLVLYRRLVQGRALTGPTAKERPTRGWGVDPRPSRARAGRRRPVDLEELVRLRDAGVITPEEFEAKRAELAGGR